VQNVKEQKTQVKLIFIYLKRSGKEKNDTKTKKNYHEIKNH